MTDKPSIEEFNVNGAQVWVKSDNPHLKQFIIEAVRDHGEDPGYFPKATPESHGPSVVDLGSIEMRHRFAKESIGMATVELNCAYAAFSITEENVIVPNGPINEANRLLSGALRALEEIYATDEIPF